MPRFQKGQAGSRSNKLESINIVALIDKRLTIVKMEPDGQDRFSFKIDKVKKSGGSKIDDKLFQSPEDYIKVEAPLI